MRRIHVVLYTCVILSIAVVFGGIYHESAQAQYQLLSSVFGVGGGMLTSSSHRIVGTIGQPVIGVEASTANNNYVGYWYTLMYPTTGVKREPLITPPVEYRLEQNYPNPFNPSTTIGFSLPRSSFVTLRVYSLLGEEVATLVEEELTEGRYTTEWTAGGAASGVYYYRLQATHRDAGTSSYDGRFIETRRLILLK
jgi:hypothetical protein